MALSLGLAFLPSPCPSQQTSTVESIVQQEIQSSDADSLVKEETSEKIVIQPPSAPSVNKEQVGPTVKDIEVEYVGPKSVSKDVILSNMRTTVGQPFTPNSVEEDVKNLYATGFFVNLRIYDEPLADGVKVVVIVQPKPTIKEVVINGTKGLGKGRIEKKITSKVGDTLSEQKVAADAQAVEDYYQEKGYKNAQVQYKIDVNEQLGRAVVTYNINEGEQLFITEIEFKGVKAFSSDDLRKVMKTKTKNLLSFINKSGKFLDEKFNEDIRLLREYYFNHGYIDMSVQDVQFEKYSPEHLRLTVTIFEGIQYKVGQVTIDGNTLFTTEDIKKHMTMLPGDVYSLEVLNKDIQAIKDIYGKKGYVDTEVNPARQPNIESGRMDLVYTIKEGPQFFVEKIVIQGNNRTKDKVLRRELALSPGDVYDSTRVDASKKRLENLGYFSKVDVTSEEVGVPGRRNLVLSVEEKRTGSVSFGAGFSTVDSVLGFVEVQQGNFDITNPPYFMGAGQKFRSRLQYGLYRKDALLSVTEPWFLNQKISLGVDVFYNESGYLSSRYNQRRVGGAVRLARALNQFWTISLKYQLENYDIYDVDNDASSLIREEEGSRSKSSVALALSYDTRDDVFLTRHGEKVQLSAEGAGGPLMGDTKIWKLQAEAQKYFLLPYDLIFSMNGVTGVADTHSGGDRVPIFDRFFIGGSRSVRGFDYREVGPRDPDGEPIGGLTMGYANLELTYPIMDRVRGAVFLDAGFDNSGTFDYSLADYQMGAGLGLRMDLPIGPMRIDFGFPIVYDDLNDKTFNFHFDVGYQF